MSVYDDKPWLARYESGQPADIDVAFPDVLAMWRDAGARGPQRGARRYFYRAVEIGRRPAEHPSPFKTPCPLLL